MGIHVARVMGDVYGNYASFYAVNGQASRTVVQPGMTAGDCHLRAHRGTVGLTHESRSSAAFNRHRC